jgi:carbamoyltransferase
MMSHLRAVQWKYANEQFAYMAQRVVEDVCVRLAGEAVRLTGSRRLALSGGVASNIKSNRLMRRRADVDDVFVFPHMGDGGLAVGAAAAAMLSCGIAQAGNWSAIDLGPDFSEQEAGVALNEAGLVTTQPSNLVQQVARLIAEGRVVLWCHGRMEYGPRALGHRSILARPDRVEIRDRLNLVLKQRVWYQPFCPSMLESDARRVLSDYEGPPNPHMTMGFMTSPEMRPALAAVISVDGSCRPQIIPDSAPGEFPDLLREVRAQTSLGVVLNTSYNIHGEPLVCTPAEAIQVYRQTAADALVLGCHLVVRSVEARR